MTGPTTPLSRDGRVRVVVATTVLLSFISFWRAAAIVLADLGSTAFYVGGIVEQAVGQSAPWFILGVMIFSYAVRALYNRELRHVRSGRRVPRRQGGDGRHAGEAVGVGAAVRLRADRPDQRRLGGRVQSRASRTIFSRAPARPNASRKTRRRRRSRSRSRSISGGATRAASTRAARTRCAS